MSQKTKSRTQPASSAPAPKLPTGPTRVAFTATPAFDLQAAGAGGGDALATFKMVAYTGVPMRVEGFYHPVLLDLEGIKVPSQARPVRLQHDSYMGVGHTTGVEIVEGKVVATGVVSRATDAAREVVAAAKNGFPWQASLGASLDEYEFVRENQKVTVNGRTYQGPLVVGRKWTIGEISFVDSGADGRTSVKVAAAEPATESAAPATPADDPAEPPAAPSQPATVRAAAADDESAISRIRAQAAAEHLRIDGIVRATQANPEIRAQAIADGWTVERAELEVLRKERGKAPRPNAASSPPSAAVLECAALSAGKFEGVEKLYDAPTLEAAHKRFRGGVGLNEMLVECARAHGYDGPAKDLRQVLSFAFNGHVQAAGFSTIDIGGILSNIGNKFLLLGFFGVEDTWRAITAVRNVRDFKTVTSYRLTGTEQYERVAPGGQVKHGTLGEETYTNKADTYGLMLQIDRRDIINDDMGSITTVPRRLGRGAGLKINDVFWTEFMANSGFFTSGNGNYIEGATTALGIDGLTAAEKAFIDQVDADGKPIGVSPAILLVPSGLNAMGAQLMNSMEIRDTTASTKFPVANPHVGKFELKMSRYLGNTAYTGNSQKAFYLLANPQDVAVIETAFLNGQESPTIETADADFDVLGVRMRGYHDFGVSKQDPKGGVKSKGEA